MHLQLKLTRQISVWEYTKSIHTTHLVTDMMTKIAYLSNVQFSKGSELGSYRNLQ